MFKKFIPIIFIMSILLSGCQYTAKEWGGDVIVTLKPGEKLEEITWKNDSLWYLTRPMRDDEEAETHVFKQSSNFGVFEGTVTIIEKSS